MTSTITKYHLILRSQTLQVSPSLPTWALMSPYEVSSWSKPLQEIPRRLNLSELFSSTKTDVSQCFPVCNRHISVHHRCRWDIVISERLLRILTSLSASFLGQIQKLRDSHSMFQSNKAHPFAHVHLQAPFPGYVSDAVTRCKATATSGKCALTTRCCRKLVMTSQYVTDTNME